MCGRDSSVQAGDRTDQRRAREGGVTLVELMLAFVVLTVAILGTISTVISVDSLQQRTEAQDAATRAASDTLERLRNGDLATQLAYYATHATFTDGTQNVTVSFPAVSATASTPNLVLSNTCFADTNGDGQVDCNAARPTSPGLLPVRIVVGTGPNQVVIQALVMKP